MRFRQLRESSGNLTTFDIELFGNAGVWPWPRCRAYDTGVPSRPCRPRACGCPSLVAAQIQKEMKTTAVLIIAGILLSFVTLKLVIPLFFLYRGFGTEVTLPSWLVRALPPRATIYL